jgi:hypothetical protein
MANLQPLPREVDLTTEFFHICDTAYAPGAHKPAGTYGLSLGLPNSTSDDPLGEHLREQIRRDHYSTKPSRFASSFVCETLQDAEEFRLRTGRKGAIYRVRFTNTGAPSHRVCWSAFQMDSGPYGPSNAKMAHQFWANPDTYPTNNEVFAESDLEIIVQCLPPLP